MKKIIVCFDGTGNKPQDAEQDVDKRTGEIEDDNITNVLKLHLLAGGSLDNEAENVPGQRSLYYSGIGTRGTVFRRTLRTLFALRGPKVVMREAKRDLEEIYEAGDRLYLFGFSRGAATARRFAARLAKEGLKTRTGESVDNPPIEVLGVWDTVASFGKPDLDKDEPPTSDVLFEDGRVAENVRRAVHLVALDDRRVAFRPTLMSAEPRIHEVWFAGVHSDVGGGFRESGLSDISLAYMMARVGEGEHKLDFLSVDEVADTALRGSDDEGSQIDGDDLAMVPNPEAPQHTNKGVSRHGKVRRHIRAARDVRKVRNDETLPDAPALIHHSVVERIKRVPDYRPENLEGVPHKVVAADGREGEEVHAGLGDHLAGG